MERACENNDFQGRIRLPASGNRRLQPRQPDDVPAAVMRVRDAHITLAMLATLCSRDGNADRRQRRYAGHQDRHHRQHGGKEKDLALRIQADFTVCVDYADFLGCTSIAHDGGGRSRLLVTATSPDDQRTSSGSAAITASPSCPHDSHVRQRPAVQARGRDRRGAAGLAASRLDSGRRR